MIEIEGIVGYCDVEGGFVCKVGKAVGEELG